MRYCGQRNQFSCGPIAILNILKTFRKNISYKSHYKTLFKQTGCDKNGTFDNGLENCLKKQKLCYSIVRQPTIHDINDALKKGPIIFGYYDPNHEGHYAVITEYRELDGLGRKSYFFINASNGHFHKTAVWVDEALLEQELFSSDVREPGFPKLWVFPRGKNDLGREKSRTRIA